MNKPVRLIIFLTAIISLGLQSKFFLEDSKAGKEDLSKTMQFAVVISAAPVGTLPTIQAGYCQPGRVSVTFTNEGMGNDPAQSLVTNVAAGIALGDGFQLQQGGFNIMGIRVAGVDLTTIQAMNGLHGNPLFTVDPDGAGGLTDADGDSFFDDLPLGASLEVTAFYEANCSVAALADTENNCLNDLSTTINARLVYEEVGGALGTFTLPNVLRPASRNVNIENFSDPDAFAGVDTFFVIHRQHRSFRDFNQNCSHGDQFVVRTVMPAGVHPVTGSTYLSKNGNVFLSLLSSQIVNDTLELVFNSAQSLFLSGDYELRLAFTTDCSVALGPSVFPMTFEHYCPSCNCRHIWYCGDLDGPQMHNTSPPCSPDALLRCDNGVQTIDFQASRTTFGFSDPDLTTPFNPALANRKVALACDSVEMRVLGLVGAASLNDSVGVVITYENVDGSNSAVETFLFGDGLVRLTHNGSEFTCPVTPGMLSVASNGFVKKLTFELNDCLTGLGLTLDPGDTIDFVGNFYVNPQGPYDIDFKKLGGFRAYTFARINGLEVSCDDFGQIFSLAKPQVVFDFPNTNTGFPAGCDNGELSWRLFVSDNEFNSYFGNEIRPAAKVDSIVFDFNPALLAAFGPTEVAVSIPGHPVFGESYFTIPPLSDFPDGHYVASFDTLNRVPTLNQVQEYIFDLRITLTPTCAAALSGTTGDNSYQIASNISYTDRYYAISIGDGSCAESITDEALSTVVYNQPPTFALSALTAVIDTVANNSVSWDIQLCNTSATADAGLTWLALEDPAGVLSTVFFENITNPANAVALPVENYNAGSFAYTPALLRNNGLNSQDAYCTTIRITATVNDCRDASLALRSGWNCGPYAAANWNPGLYPPCEEQNLALSLTNLAVPPVQLGFQQVTSSCSGAGLETVNIRGTLSGGANVPQDDYRLRFIWDENGDATAQAGETVLAQLVVSGTISPDNPLVFNQLLQLTTVQACAVLVELTAVQTDLCGTVAAAMPSPQLLNAGTDQFVCTLDAPGTLTFNLGITSCDEASGHQFSWTAIAPASPADLDNPAVQNPVLTLDPVEHLGQTLVYVLETQKPGCIASSFDTVSVEIPVFSDGFSTADSVILQAPSCQSTADLCLNITAENLPNLVFFDNGFTFTGTPVSCSDTLFALQLTAGTHQVIITDTLSGCTDTVFVAVSCAIKDTVYLDLLLHQADTVCFSSAELSGPVISLQNDCEEGLFADYLVEDTCLIVIGQFAGQETACMVACDAAGFCDTTIVITTISHPLPNGIRDTITLTQEGEYCFDEQLLNLAGPIVSMENICTVEGGSAVSFSMDEANNCLQYTGLAVGVDSACIRLCDGFGNCDTVGVAVTVVPGNVIMDTVFIHLDTNFLCAEAGLLPGNIVSVTDICPEDKGMEVVFFVSGECIRYFGKAVGTDTACVRFEDEFGNVALTQVIVSVVNTTPITFCDTVFVGQTKALCLDTTELFGAYDQDSFREICPDIRTENAGFSLEPLNICAFYEGVTPGKDSACVVICDEFGFCDTTYFCIFVKPYFDPPTLGNDTAYTEKARPVVIDFLQNDTIFGGIEDIYILDSTISGQVILNLDNSFTYIPTDPFCARWDHFTYVACNPNGCDTATVSIYIECIRLTIFTAISPNNDGANDLFYIAKIEDFPDNRLWVYNRWGNLVFETRAYKNTWPGNWGPDTDLPDGTYYYVLEWVDNGVTTVQRGYFEMYR